jgi:hypothetical protein
MTNPIVNVSVSQTQAPIPNTVQKTGAMVSQGGTVLTPGQFSLLTQYSDLAVLLPTALALTSLAWASTFGGQVTATTAVAHGVTVGNQFTAVIAGVAPLGYNGTFAATATGTSTFTYSLAVNPGGASTTPGTYLPAAAGNLQSMANTFFSQQGSAQGIYVLELGSPMTAPAGVAILSDFINSSPQFFYSYLVPRYWDGDASFLAFLASFQSTTAKTYFFITTTAGTTQLVNGVSKSVYDGMKSVLALIEAPGYGVWAQNAITATAWASGSVTATTTTAHGVQPGQQFTLAGILPVTYNGTFIALPGTSGSSLIYAKSSNPGAYVSGGNLLQSRYSNGSLPASEFTHASDFFVTLAYDPGPASRVPQLGFSYLYGVTAYPRLGNNAAIAGLEAANINYVGTGAEGGQPTNTILFDGLMMDGRPFNYWYSTDYVQINAKLAIANAVINGSNTTINPLYYNQQGIDRLQQALTGMMGSAITAGLVLGTVIQLSYDALTLSSVLSSGRYNGSAVINAVPFTTYSIANPSHYRLGIYNGLSITFTPLAGFRSITVYINVTDFVG